MLPDMKRELAKQGIQWNVNASTCHENIAMDCHSPVLYGSLHARHRYATRDAGDVATNVWSDPLEADESSLVAGTLMEGRVKAGKLRAGQII